VPSNIDFVYVENKQKLSFWQFWHASISLTLENQALNESKIMILNQPKNLAKWGTGTGAASHLVGVINGKPSRLAVIRVWRSKSGQTVRATVWCFTKGYASGTGVARGSGYDKTSAAIRLAFEDAGFSEILAEDKYKLFDELGSFLSNGAPFSINE